MLSSSRDPQAPQTAGALLGEGVYGCAFSPPLKCKGKPRKPTNVVTRRVGKLTTDFDAYWESRITEYLKRNPLAPNYFILIDESCQPDTRDAQKEESELDKCSVVRKKRITDFKQITMAFGGKALSQSTFRSDRFDLFAFMKHLLEAGSLLLLSGVVHTDLHNGNIVLDEYQVPRFIDFGMAMIPKDLKEDLIPFIAHQPDFIFTQEPPEVSLLWATYANVADEDTAHEIITQKKIFKIIQAVTGVTLEESETELEIFQNRSKSLQDNDPLAFFQTYWPQYDAWSIGTVLVSLVRGFMYSNGFSENKSYAKHKVVFEKVLKGLTEVNPVRRMDAIEALSVLCGDDPSESFVLENYAGDWLKIRHEQKRKGGV